jgi:ABC-type bacteriocin/lantibiotic exporter with double-glycine peptidase domain
MLYRTLTVIVFWTGVCGVLCAAAPSGIWLDVPFVRQAKDGCGAASVAMIMQYWEKQQGEAFQPGADAVTIQRILYSSEAHGIYASAIEQYLRKNGFQTFAVEGTWADLRQHLEKGRPLLVALKPGGNAPLHYVVVAGLEQEDGIVLQNDPAQRKLLKQNRSDFERAWKRADNWMLLALPASTTPESAQ